MDIIIYVKFQITTVQAIDDLTLSGDKNFV